MSTGANQYQDWCTPAELNASFVTRAVGGLPGVRIYGLHRFQNTDDGPTACRIVFCAHWRGGDVNGVDAMCRAFVSQNDDESVKGPPLLAVAFDQRNHGERLVDERANYSWLERERPDMTNPNHAIDMYALQMGTTQDISFLIDHLPGLLEAEHGIHDVTKFGVCGISLGGHVAFLSVANDPRIDMAISIVGCGDYATLMHERHTKLVSRFPDESFDTWARAWPAALDRLVSRVDPIQRITQRDGPGARFVLCANLPKIMYLGGGQDGLVPVSANAQFWSRLAAIYARAEREEDLVHVVDPEAGHVCSKMMVKESVRFVRTWLTQ
ncbi:hypothetical protein GGF31_003252 [Allomyces arbusculus]|nr:hypothetical protein GGF31_003252 [Allomyces arbusculus]